MSRTQTMPFSKAKTLIKGPVCITAKFKSSLVVMTDRNKTIICYGTSLHELANWIKNDKPQIVVFDLFKFIYNIKALTSIELEEDNILGINLVSIACKKNLIPSSASYVVSSQLLNRIFTSLPFDEANMRYIMLQTWLITLAIKYNFKPSTYYYIRDHKLWRMV